MFIHSLSSQLRAYWGLDTVRQFGDSKRGWIEEEQTILLVPDNRERLNMEMDRELRNQGTEQLRTQPYMVTDSEVREA